MQDKVNEADEAGRRSVLLLVERSGDLRFLRGLVTDQNLREMLSKAKGKFATQPDASAIIGLMMLTHRRP